MNPDCTRMIGLFLVALFLITTFLDPMLDRFVERGRQIAIAHGCQSPSRCVKWEWWFN